MTTYFFKFDPAFGNLGKEDLWLANKRSLHVDIGRWPGTSSNHRKANYGEANSQTF